MTLYIHLDIWAFELLDSKIRMYEKITEKDYYTRMVGLHPIWLGNKMVIKDFIDNKYWDYLYNKKKIFSKRIKISYKKKRKKIFFIL